LKIRACVAMAAIPPLLSLVSFKRLCGWLESSPLPAVSPGLDAPALAVWVDRWLYALPRPWRHTCLKRSTILYYLFRREGLPVEMCIGVSRGPSGNLTAHAWLVRDGAPYLEREQSPSASHTPIARFPERQEFTA
jgi:hypothetical protein